MVTFSHESKNKNYCLNTRKNHSNLAYSNAFRADKVPRKLRNFNKIFRYHTHKNEITLFLTMNFQNRDRKVHSHNDHDNKEIIIINRQK